MRKKLQRYILTDEIYKLIKEQILSHELNPGGKINIDQMARELGVSNIPIREALSRLSSEGLITFVPFKGMFVTNMSLKELNEIFEIRINLETLAVEKATTAIPDLELDKMDRKMMSFQNVRPENSPEALRLIVEMNDALHGLILDYCGNSTLKKLIQGYIEHIERYLTFIGSNIKVDFSYKEWEEHAEILRLLINRDANGAVEAMSNHLIRSRERTVALFK